MNFLRISTLIMLLSAFFNASSQQTTEEPTLDTRIDNNGYWKKAAEHGLTELNPVRQVAPATYTGSEIRALSTITDDSPDVPVVTGSTSQSENSIFVNPDDFENVLNSNNSTSTPGGGLTLYGANDLFSFDGGLTWDGELEGAGGNNSGDPAALVGLNGRWYVGYIDNGGQGVSWSDDNGQTWSSTQVAPAPPGFSSLLDKNHMWIDNKPGSPYEGYLYNAWTAFGGSNDSDIEICYSADDGETWSSRVNISSAVNAGSHNQGVNISTGPNGEVYAVWTIYDNWPQDENAMGLARSYDGGQTWESFRIIENIKGIRNYGTGKDQRVNSFPSMAVDISDGSYSGNIYVVWTNVGVPGINSGSDIDVYMIRSEDEGDSWSDPIRVNQDDTGLGKQHYFPWIVSDPLTGTLSVVFYDDRNVSSTQCEVFCANSYDAGESWEDFKVSDVSFTPSPIPGLASGYMGDYLGISAHGGYVYPCWTDNRTGTALTYVSPYQTSTMTPPANLVATVDDETGVVDLSWEHPLGPTFSYFKIYRGFTLIGTATFPTFTDTLPDYGYYRYSVTAYYTIEGESGPVSADVQWGSAQVNVDPAAIEKFLSPGSTGTEVMTISNTGELPLEWTGQVAPPESENQGSRSYCTALGGCQEFIANVRFADIDNHSGCGEYQDFTNLSTTLIAGQSLDIMVYNGYDNQPTDVCGIWIDWNNNEVFTDDGSISVNGSPGIGPYTATVTVPDDAATGTVRMRIRITRGGTPSPCGLTQYGEVEDYSLQVIGWLQASPLEGEVDPGASGQVDLTFNASQLENGTYEAVMNLSTNDPANPEVIVPVTLNVQDITLNVYTDKDSICNGSSTRLYAQVTGGSGSATYAWTSDPAGFTSQEPEPLVSPQETTTYFVEVNDQGNILNDQVTITVVPLPEPDLGPDRVICEGETTSLDAGAGYAEYVWNTGETTQSIMADETGYYWVNVSNDFGCAQRDSVYLEVAPLPVIDLGEDFSFCENETVTLDAGEGFASYLWNTGETDRTIEVNEAGSYWVTVSNQNECQSSDTIMLAVDPLPGTAAVTTGPSTIDLYETTTSDISAAAIPDADDYQWNLEPPSAGDIIGNGTQAEITWENSFTGIASVTVTGINTCGNGTVSEPFQILVYSSLGTNDMDDLSGFRIYPNPNKGIFKLELNSQIDGIFRLRIADMHGIRTYDEQIQLNRGIQTISLNLPELSTGIYTVSIENESGRAERRIVIRK